MREIRILLLAATWMLAIPVLADEGEAAPCPRDDVSCPVVELVNSMWGDSLRSFGSVVDIGDASLEIYGRHLGVPGSSVTVLVAGDAAAEPRQLPGSVVVQDEVVVKTPPLGTSKILRVAVVVGGRRSEFLHVKVIPRDVPVVVRTVPEHPTRGATVRLEGAGFVNSSRVHAEEEPVAAKYLGPTALELTWPARLLEARVTVRNGAAISEPLGVTSSNIVRGTLRLPGKVDTPSSQIRILDHQDQVSPNAQWSADVQVSGGCELIQIGRATNSDQLIDRYYGQALVAGDDAAPTWDPLSTAVAAVLVGRLLAADHATSPCDLRSAVAVLPSVKALADRIERDLSSDGDYVKLLQSNPDLYRAAIIESKGVSPPP